MFFSHKLRVLFIFLAFSSYITLTTPRLTIIFIVDQFAHHYINRLKPHMRGGIYNLLENGIVKRKIPDANRIIINKLLVLYFVVNISPR